MNSDNDENGAPRRSSRSHPAIIASVNSPERLLHSSPAAVTTMPNVPAPVAEVTTQSFATATQGATPMLAPLDLAARLDDALESVRVEDTVEVARGEGEGTSTDHAARTRPSLMEDTTTNAPPPGYTQVRSEEIPPSVYSRTKELVRAAATDMQLATKDYVTSETRKVREDISSIVTVEVASALQNADEGIIRNAITDAVQSPVSLDLMMNQFLSSDAVMKTIARFVASRVDVAMAKVVSDLTNIDKGETSDGPQPTRKKRHESRKIKKEKTMSKKKKNAQYQFSSDSLTSSDADGTSGTDTSDSDDSSPDEVVQKPKKERGVNVLRPVNPLFRSAVDYRTYRLRLTEKQYTDEDARKMKRWITGAEVEMRTRLFNGSDPITILTFLSSFRSSCDSIGVHEGAALWLFQYFLRDPAKASLTARLGRPHERGSKAGKLTSYCQVVNHLLRTFATDDIIAEAEADLTRCVQTDKMTEAQFEALLWKKALRCGSVFPETRLRSLFIEGLNATIRQIVRGEWARHPDADLGTLQRYATSMAHIAHSNRKTVVDEGTRGGRRSGVMAIETDSMTNPPGPPTTTSSGTSQRGSTSTSQPSLDLVETALESEILVLQNSGSTVTDEDIESLRSSIAMDAGDNCRVCFAYRRHKSSKCPWISGASSHDEFVVERNRNFARFLKVRRSRQGSQGYSGPRTAPTGTATPSTNRSTTAVRTGPAPTNQNSGN